MSLSCSLNRRVSRQSQSILVLDDAGGPEIDAFLKRVPEEEEQMEVEGLRIIIKKMKGPKIVLAKVLKLD